MHSLKYKELSYFDIQGVPINLEIERRLEYRL